jgi:hypothetical protein
MGDIVVVNVFIPDGCIKAPPVVINTQLVHFCWPKVLFSVRDLVQRLHGEYRSDEVGLADRFSKNAKPLVQNIVSVTHYQKEDFDLIEVAVFDSMTQEAKHLFVLGHDS